MAVLLERQLVLPAALCSCRDIQGLAQCEGQPEPEPCHQTSRDLPCLAAQNNNARLAPEGASLAAQ